VTRVIGLLVHNWPLKLAAVGLAILLYGGLVLSQSSRIFPGPIPVTPINYPAGTFLLTAPEPVRLIRYLAPPSVQPIASTFVAEVDLSQIEAGAGPQSAPIIVRAIDDRIRVLSSEPDVMTVQLDNVESRSVPVVVDRGSPPNGIEVGETTVSPTEVTVTGPASIVNTVVAARATVVIQPDGFTIDQDVPLTPIDQLGNPVSPAKVEPTTAHVKIPVFSDRSSKTVPISPVITGTPAGGFELASVTVEPPTVTVEGNADQLVNVVSIATEPIPLTGLSSKTTREVALALPAGVEAIDVQTVQVVIDLRPVTATRSFDVGLELVGEDPALAYALGTDRVNIVVGGSTADLDRLTGSSLVAQLDVSALEAGTSDVPVSADLPAGVTLVRASPATVSVTVTARAAPAASASGAPATPTPTPTATPGG
jgi:YbbR domain-containing protein